MLEIKGWPKSFEIDVKKARENLEDNLQVCNVSHEAVTVDSWDLLLVLTALNKFYQRDWQKREETFSF